MKKIKWIAVLCLILAVLTLGASFARYVTTLTDSIKLNIRAQLYTLTYSAPFAHNGNEGIVHVDKQVANPEFTIGNYPAEHEYLKFVCWEDQDGKHYNAGDTIKLADFNGILRAVYSLDHNVLENGSGQDGGKYFGDLIIDKESGDFVLEFNGQSNCEMVFFPLKNLVVGGRYTYSFDFYYEAPNGIDFYCRNNKGRIDVGGNTDGSAHVFGYFLADENNKDLIQADDNHTLLSNHAVVYDSFEGVTVKTNFSQTFTATDNTMYLGMVMCDINDYKGVNLHWNSIEVTRQENDADINLNHANNWGTDTTYATTAGNQAISNIVVDIDSVKFTIKGVGGVERYAIPITGLSSGQNYTVSFDFKGNPSALINENKNNPSQLNFYQYGYCIASDLTNLRINPGYTWELFTPYENAQPYSTSFTASGSTAYLILNFSNVGDNTPFGFELTKLHVKRSEKGGTLALPIQYPDAELPSAIFIDIDGINESNMDWLPISEHEDMKPYPNEDYTVRFAAHEGYALEAAITVVIDGTVYAVATDGSSNAEGVPTFDPATGILTVPAVLLTEQTQSVSIEAAALELPAEPVETPAVEEAVAPEATATEQPAAAESPVTEP